jgi:hypothetical protein
MKSWSWTMQRQEHSAIVSRITPRQADDIDSLLSQFGGRNRLPGQDLFPELAAVLPPEPRFKRADSICVGYRAVGPLADAPDRAARLASLALERDVEVIVLSEADVSGLEQFGFRVERIPPDDTLNRDAWIDQVRRFWGLDLVL